MSRSSLRLETTFFNALRASGLELASSAALSACSASSNTSLAWLNFSNRTSAAALSLSAIVVK